AGRGKGVEERDVAWYVYPGRGKALAHHRERGRHDDQCCVLVDKDLSGELVHPQRPVLAALRQCGQHLGCESGVRRRPIERRGSGSSSLHPELAKEVCWMRVTPQEGPQLAGHRKGQADEIRRGQQESGRQSPRTGAGSVLKVEITVKTRGFTA